MATIFPTQLLAVKIEMLINTTWTDISTFLYQRDPILITQMGRPNQASQMQSAQVTMTLANIAGRFSHDVTTSPYYPYVQRNTQVRISVNASSVNLATTPAVPASTVNVTNPLSQSIFVTITGGTISNVLVNGTSVGTTDGTYTVPAGQTISITYTVAPTWSWTTTSTYSGFRFWGEIVVLPNAWDPTNTDVYCQITASGIWRRISQSTISIGSPFRRYNTLTVGTAGGLVAYWPMEDGQGSLTLVSYVPGGSNMTFTGTPSFASNSLFLGSDAIPTFNAAVFTGLVSGGTVTDNATRFLLSVPTAGDSASGTTDWNVIEVDSSGTVAKFEVYLNFAGTLAINLRNSSGTIIASGTTVTNTKGQNLLCSCELTPSGSSVAWAFRLIKPGAGAILESLTGTIATASVGAITKVLINRAGVLFDTALGHVAVMYQVPSLVTADFPLNGYSGEAALTRFTRLCGELGIATETIGSTSAPLGPQVDATPGAVLQMIETSDGGLLYETKDQFGLGYRSQSSMVAQSVALALNYTAASVSQQMVPTYDDVYVKNDIIVQNYDGYSVEAILTAGRLSVQNPPNGIGTGYQQVIQVSLAADTQVAGLADFLLGVLAAPGERYPSISVDQGRSEVASNFATIPGVRIGDYLQITNPLYVVSPINQLIWGYNETLNARTWTFDFNTVSELPWATGYSPGTVSTTQVSGASVNQTQSFNADSISGLIGIPGQTLVSLIGISSTGQVVVISATAPANPNVGQVWINSSTGVISQWNGTSWVAVSFNATDTIQAGTIIGSLILAGTITASLVAAGTIIAGIVDTTTVQAGTYIATGTQGEYLAYSGTPASGNLVVSVSGLNGSDSFSNAYHVGVEVHIGGLILDSQSSAPSAVSGASVLYTAASGRPFLLAASGDSSVIERSVVNVANFPLGNTTTPTTMSAFTTYRANEGVQSSEYEIEVIGTGTWGNPTLSGFLWQMFIDGSAPGGGTIGQFTVGVGGQTAGATFGYCIIYTLSVTAVGSSGTAIICARGTIWDQSANRVPSNSVAVGAMSPGATFDTTSNHTLQLYAWFASSETGNSMSTDRTRITRRN